MVIVEVTTVHHLMILPTITMEAHHLPHTDERNAQQLNVRNVAMVVAVVMVVAMVVIEEVMEILKEVMEILKEVMEILKEVMEIPKEVMVEEVMVEEVKVVEVMAEEVMEIQTGEMALMDLAGSAGLEDLFLFHHFHLAYLWLLLLYQVQLVFQVSSDCQVFHLQ